MRKQLLICFFLLLLLLTACNFPLGNFASQSTPQTLFRTQIPHTVNFPTRIPTIFIEPSPPPLGNLENEYVYTSLSGDTLATVARHFGVEPSQISSSTTIRPLGLIPPGQVLYIPKTVTDFFYSDVLFPDSELIYSPTASDFNVAQFISAFGGYLQTYQQTVSGDILTGAQIVDRVAENTSTNPRLLLAVIELRSHWVTQNPVDPNYVHPLDLGLKDYTGLYLELAVAARLLNTGYYGWRSGEMTDLIFSDGSSARIAPNLNAGTVGVQYLMAQLYDQNGWETMMYGPESLASIHKNFFGDPFTRAASVEPMFTENTGLPVLELPFAPGQPWALTGGLHYDWTLGTPFGALDFAPITGENPCAISRVWVLASAPGRVIHASNNFVIIGLENENGIQTGWEVMYMHISRDGMIPLGTHVQLDDQIGHPSCEGGNATGTHVHVTRKFKGEWIGAGEPFPFILSGWLANPGTRIFQSTLTKGDLVITASQTGSINSHITR